MNYNDHLVRQYQDANGYKYVDLKSKCFQDEYLEWLKLKKEQGYKYLDFLYRIRKDIIERTTAEVGKSTDDSLSLYEFMNNIIISTYEFPNNVDKKRIIPVQMNVIDEEIGLNFFSNRPQTMILPKQINLLMTENPYTPYSILNWEDLHNSGNYDIAVGIYGSIYDKDIKQKINILKSLKNKFILDDYIYYLNQYDDIYYGALVSNRKK